MKLHFIRILIVLLAAAGFYFSWRYYQDVIKPERQLDSADTQQNALFERIKPAISIDSVESSSPPAETEIEIETASAPEISETFTPSAVHDSPLSNVEEINSDAVGWITIPNTNIDYPISQCEDNDFYLHHGFDKAYNYELGCPFLDYRCERNFEGFNSIVYAHHMTKQRMFADIALYKDSSFIEYCPVGYLTTQKGQYLVRFFAYLNVPSNAPVYQVVFDDGQDYLHYIFSSADYIYQVSEEELNQIEHLHLLLLSTCTFEFEEARGVLVGVIEPNID